MKHISLFSGVGMTDLAMERLGWKTIITSEVDPFCQDVLRVRFPAAIHCGDVATVSVMDDVLRHASAPPGELLVSGGFPCQDVSSAGTAAGLNGQRSGLWAEMARVIREFKPGHVFIENAAILRARGLDRILSDLYDLGYDAAWDCVPAAAVGAPHIRDRIFIYARKTRGDRDYTSVENYLGFTVTLGCYDDDMKRIKKFPRAGALLGGIIAEREAQFPTKGYRKAGLWPTPTRADGSGGPGTTPKRTGGKNLRTAIAEQEGNGRLNPTWIEALMGLPLGWTSLACRMPSHELSSADGIYSYVVASEDLRRLRGRVLAETLQREAGRRGCLPSPEALLAILREYQDDSDILGLSVASTKVSQASVRELWAGDQSSGASCRSGSIQQPSQQSANALQTLSRLLACDAKAVGLEDRWQDAFPNRWSGDWEHGLGRTVAHRVPLRAKRIRALGNGLVPQAAEAAYISLRKELSNA